MRGRGEKPRPPHPLRRGEGSKKERAARAAFHPLLAAFRRVEYRVAELPIFLIPVLLTAPDRGAFLSAAFWEGLCVFLFLFSFGDLLNCLADRDLDAIYKPHLTEAVDGLTKSGVVVQAALSALAALALTIHLAWLARPLALLPLVAAGLVVAYAYSVEPLRLKGADCGNWASTGSGCSPGR